LIEGEQRRPVEFKVGQYPGWQKLSQPVPVLQLSPVRSGQKLRGRKTLRRARSSVVVLSRHHEFLPVDVKPELEQRASPGYLHSSRRGCGGHTVRNGVLFHKAGESTKTHPHPLHVIYVLSEPGHRALVAIYASRAHPTFMSRQLCIYVDVDDTLVRSAGCKRIPVPAVIQHVAEPHRDGVLLYCWSSGGADYARQSAEEFGIAHYFTATRHHRRSTCGRVASVSSRSSFFHAHTRRVSSHSRRNLSCCNQRRLIKRLQRCAPAARCEVKERFVD
jgi:hypothetical protein